MKKGEAREKEMNVDPKYYRELHERIYKSIFRNTIGNLSSSLDVWPLLEICP